MWSWKNSAVYEGKPTLFLLLSHSSKAQSFLPPNGNMTELCLTCHHTVKMNIQDLHKQPFFRNAFPEQQFGSLGLKCYFRCTLHYGI